MEGGGVVVVVVVAVAVVVVMMITFETCILLYRFDISHVLDKTGKASSVPISCW